MKIKLVRNLGRSYQDQLGKHPLVEGEEHQVDRTLGEHLIIRGLAVQIEEPEPVKLPAKAPEPVKVAAPVLPVPPKQAAPTPAHTTPASAAKKDK